MKKLDQFIVKSFLGPFIGILLVVIFILMLQFLWLYIDELVGRDWGLKIILGIPRMGSSDYGCRCHSHLRHCYLR